MNSKDQNQLANTQNNPTFGQQTNPVKVPTKTPAQVFPASINQQISNQPDNDDKKSQSSQKSAKRKGSLVSQQSRNQSEEQRLNQKKKADAKAIFLQNVDYKTTKEQLQLLFEDCDTIEKVTILKNNITGQPKGCAYISFDTEQGVQRALHLSGIMLRNRTIRVHRKRTNLPGVRRDKPGGDMKMNFLEMMQNYTRGSSRGRSRGRGRGR